MNCGYLRSLFIHQWDHLFLIVWQIAKALLPVDTLDTMDRDSDPLWYWSIFDMVHFVLVNLIVQPIA